MSFVKKVLNKLAPQAAKGDDGRDMFTSRMTFILCAMGGAVGLGNLLRFPSIVYNNYGAQFFIPYLIALTFIAIPILVLEIAIGTAYRSGCVLAWSHADKRARGIGLAVVFNGYSVVTYYVPLLAWVMKYFQRSFYSTLPWAGQDTAEFFMNVIVEQVNPIEGSLNDDGTVASYSSWPGTAIVPQTAAWMVFVWFITWLCMFRGVGLTGRVIYFTMIAPLVMIIILLGRSVSLPNAGDGVKLYFGTWRTSALASRQIWQDAFGQIFFSIGVGFGYFTSWASYCSQHSNCVQDAIIIALSNSSVEIIAAFAVFGIVGYLGLDPATSGRLSTFTSGFITYPEALAQMPAPQFFSIVFFATLMLLGLTSAFSLLETVTTLILDTTWGGKYPRWIVCTIVTIISLLISLIYCTEFGLQALDAVDSFVNDVALFFTVWCEVFAATTMYRSKDAFSQVGMLSYGVFTIMFVIAQWLGIGIAYAVHPGAGAGVGFGIFIIGSVVAVMIAKTPDVKAPGMFGSNIFLSKFWWCAFSSGYQLSADLNTVIGVGKNWSIPYFWAPLLKFVSGPILGIVLSFAYPKFQGLMYDPIFIYGFTAMHAVMPMIIIGLIFPSWFNFLIAVDKRDKGEYPVAPLVVVDHSLDRNTHALEGGYVDGEAEKMSEEHEMKQ